MRKNKIRKAKISFRLFFILQTVGLLFFFIPRAAGAESQEPSRRNSLPKGTSGSLSQQPVIGPFSIASPGGDWLLKLGLAAQMRYELVVRNLSDEVKRDVTGTLFPRRIRLLLKGNLVSKRLMYYLHLSTAPGSLEFMDFYLDYQIRPWLWMRVGQGKVPFTRYRQCSYGSLTLVDWPMLTQYFGAERQIGLTLHNGHLNVSGLDYQLGLFSGQNARSSHEVGLAKLFGESLSNPSDLANPGARATLHPELVAHLAYTYHDMDTDQDTDFEGGPLRFHLGLSSAWDLAPDQYKELAMRVAPEILLKAHHLSFSSIFYLGFARRGEHLDQQRLGFWGWIAQTSYLINTRLELAARFAILGVDEKTRQAARDRSAAIIAEAQAPELREKLAAQYGKAGQLQSKHEATIGANIYLVGKSLKLQNDLSWLRDSFVTSSQHSLLFRTQLQLVF